MTRTEVFNLALKKATDNSKTFALRMGKYRVEGRAGWLDGDFQIEPYIKQYYGDIYEREIAWQVLAYYPEFGIALWGEKPICKLCGSEEFDAGKSFNGETTEYDPSCKKCGAQMFDELEFGNGTTLPAYLYHQQKMLTYSDPIRYLEKFVAS